jgi:hypothetical protein
MWARGGPKGARLPLGVAARQYWGSCANKCACYTGDACTCLTPSSAICGSHHRGRTDLAGAGFPLWVERDEECGGSLFTLIVNNL